MVEIRRLNPADDRELFEAAWHWLDESPQWRKETAAVFSAIDYDGYMAEALDPDRIDVGVWDSEKFIAIITLTQTSKDVYEIHFEASRHANMEALIEAGWNVRHLMFKQYNAREGFTYTVKQNRAVLAMDRTIGFTDDNISIFKGQLRGKPLEWVRISMVN